MASLYKRASPPQWRVLRIVEGAILAAAHAHPEIKIKRRSRRSIAKRAAGTLSSQWPDVLATNRRSGLRSRGAGRQSARERLVATREREPMDGNLRSAIAVGLQFTKADRAAGDTTIASPLLRVAESCLYKCMREIKAAGDEELASAVLTVLRILGRRRKFRSLPFDA